MLKSWPLIVLLVASFWIRVYIFQRMYPVVHTDSVTYFFLQDLDTVRTPGYPLFIELVLSVNDFFSFSIDYFKVICFAQLFILGLLNVWLIFILARFLTRSRIFALIMGLVYSGNFFVIGFEFQVMTETLTITLLLAILILYLKLFGGRKFMAAIAGVLMVLLIYTRPTYLLLGVFFPALIFVGFFPYSKKKKFIKKVLPPLLVFLSVTAIGVGGWSIRNQIKFGRLAMSSLMPYGLRYYTNPLFKKYKPTGDPMLDRIAEVYTEEIKRRGPSRGVYYFYRRIRKELNLSDDEISAAFLKVNLKLIKDHPLDYLKQIPGSLRNYYQQYSTHWTSGNTRIFLRKKKFFSFIFRNIFRVYKKLFSNSCLLVILLGIMPMVVIIHDRRRKKNLHGWLSLELVIQYTCLVSVLSTNAGINNLRYRAPVEPLILLVFYAGIFYVGKGLVSFLKKGFASRLSNDRRKI